MDTTTIRTPDPDDHGRGAAAGVAGDPDGRLEVGYVQQSEDWRSYSRLALVAAVVAAFATVQLLPVGSVTVTALVAVFLATTGWMVVAQLLADRAEAADVTAELARVRDEAEARLNALLVIHAVHGGCQLPELATDGTVFVCPVCDSAWVAAELHVNVETVGADGQVSGDAQTLWQLQTPTAS